MRRFRMLDLTPNDRSPAYARDVSSDGYVLGAVRKGRIEPGMVWNTGSLIELQSVGVDYLDVRAIGDDGLVVGSAAVGGVSHACFWRNGILSFLETPEGEWPSSAHDINKHGVVVGYRPRKPGFDACVFWTESRPGGPWRYTEFFPDFLPFEYTGAAMAMGINDRGTIVGVVSSFGFIKVRDTYVKLVTPEGVGVWPLAINNSDLAVGYVVDPDEQYAFRYSTSIERLKTIAGSNSHAEGVNDAGQIVGASTYERGKDDLHGCLWEAGSIHDLNECVFDIGQYIITSASAINNSGQIAATAKLQGLDRAVLLTPVD